jgi:hypothetical protein
VFPLERYQSILLLSYFGVGKILATFAPVAFRHLLPPDSGRGFLGSGYVHQSDMSFGQILKHKKISSIPFNLCYDFPGNLTL